MIPTSSPEIIISTTTKNGVETSSLELDWIGKWKHYSPHRVAMKDGLSSREITYSQFYAQACRGADYLKNQYALRAGDRVAVLAHNELSYVILFYALQRLGVVLVPINYRLTLREIAHIVSDCAPQLIVCDPTHEVAIGELNVQTPTLLLTGPSSFTSVIENSTLPHYTPFDGNNESVAMIIYTSGTTGAPKGAMITNQMIFWNSINTSLRLNVSQTDCAVVFLPFFHTGAWNVLTTPFFHRGAKIVFLNKFDAENVLQLSQDENCSLLFGVPTTMDMMAQHPLFMNIELSSVRYAVVGGEPMPLPLIEKWHAKGIPVRQGYGLTEFGPNVFSLNEEDAIRKIGSIGFANFYVETKIVDDSGNEVPAREVGELLLKGPMCMSGYWNNDEATRKTIVNGWLATGDLAYKDDEGYHYISGRKKDMYKSGGENVYPAEIEQVLRKLQGVRDAAVIGVRDDKWGEVGKAFIVSQSAISIEELHQHCLKNLAKFKIPKYFEFINELPKGDSGKILKRALVDMENSRKTAQ
jgi:fatty-acyl-CoA synthase